MTCSCIFIGAPKSGRQYFRITPSLYHTGTIQRGDQALRTSDQQTFVSKIKSSTECICPTTTHNISP